MGAAQGTEAVGGELLLDKYPIKLTSQQTVQLYGLFSTRTVLTWGDVIRAGSGITFRKCIEARVEVNKLHNMQRELEEWIRHDKVCVDDCLDLALWAPNPFLHFRCHVGDLVMRRAVLTHRVLVRGGVTFEVLWERYGLTPELMGLIRFTPEQWIELGLKAKHLAYFERPEHWALVFGKLRRGEVEQLLQRGC
jgi:hypothetical protein